jgi:rSAM/selenodomain-associated transferase 2
MKISVIIPVYNEERIIAKTINFLKTNGGNHLCDIIVIDAGSGDATIENAKHAGAVVYSSPQKGRAEQMNYGVTKASGEIFYFVHADTTPPSSFATDIIDAVKEGCYCGCYRLKFDSKKKLFFINEWFTRFDKMWCRGGDQTLFSTRKLFDNLNGFDENYVIMEEYDFIVKARKTGKFKIMKKSTLASPRKYENNSWLKVMIANYTAYKMFSKNMEPQKIKEYYKSAIKS